MEPLTLRVAIEKGQPPKFLWRQLAYAMKRAKDGRYVVTFAAEEETRSAAQNKAFHKMLEPWCAEGHDIEDLKDDLLREVFGLREKVNAITGEVTHVLAEPHTSKLTKQQFSLLMERSVQIAADCGVRLELPSEYRERITRELAG
jgi:L-lysine 2,3-aminomutase